MNQQLRVALVTDAVYPGRHGGKESRYYEVARRLGTHADVRVYTIRWWNGSRAHRHDGMNLYAICPPVDLYAGGRRSIWEAVLFALACTRLFLHRFDVLEADHMPYLPLFVLKLVTWVKRKPFVVTWHEVWGPRYWRTYLGWPGVGAWWIERLAMKLPDRIIAASAATKSRLLAILGPGANITAVPNGVDLDRIRAVQPAADRTDIVIVGRLLGHKRVDLLLDAIAILHERGLPVTARIIGDGPEEAALRRHAQRTGIAPAVDFRTDVHAQDDLYALVKAGKVFVFPSEREGFGIAVLEALACELPVVTTTAPHNLAQLLIQHTGHGLVCSPTAEALADAITGILIRGGCDSSDAETAAWIETFSWSATADRIWQVLCADRVSDPHVPIGTPQLDGAA